MTDPLPAAIIALPMADRIGLARAVHDARRALGKRERWLPGAMAKATAQVAEQTGHPHALLFALARRYVLTCPCCGAHWKKRRRAGGWRRLDVSGGRTDATVDRLPGCCEQMESPR